MDLKKFLHILERDFTLVIEGKKALAVGVSGGPDSMALLWLLSNWAKNVGGVKIHALTVDHGLRVESAAEAHQVQDWVNGWPCVVHKVLTFGALPDNMCDPSFLLDESCASVLGSTSLLSSLVSTLAPVPALTSVPTSVFSEPEFGSAPVVSLLSPSLSSSLSSSQARVMERARDGRYEAFQNYCEEEGISALFLAHHRDDQAETFLFRLARGSGLDGLSAMKSLQPRGENLTLLRPFLNVSKEDLVNLCKVQDILYVQDPSNEMEKYVRPRMRKSWAALEGEGLSSKRLAVTSMRLERARQALEYMTDKVLHEATASINTNRVVYNILPLQESPDEIALRVILRAIHHLRSNKNYLPRMEKIEVLFEDLMSDQKFRKRTLGGLIFERDDKNGYVYITHENTK